MATTNTAIAKTNKISRMLAEAKTPAQSKRVESAAAAAKAWFKEQNDFEGVVDAAKIYILARRNTTELCLPYAPKNGGDRGKNQYAKWQTNNDVRLAKFGFTWMQWSRRMRELTEVTTDDIDAYFDECVEKTIEPTVWGLMRSVLSQSHVKQNGHIGKSSNAITLIHGDMLNIVPTLDPFDLVIADPPYNVTDWRWDKFDTPAEFLAETRQWLQAIQKVLNPEYNLFWFCSPSFAADIEMILRKEEFPIQSRIVWHRRNMAMGSKSTNKFVDSWEMIFHCGNRALNFPAEWSDRWFDVQTFAVPQTNFTDVKLHPTQKPLGLIQRLIDFGSYPGDRVLDPFAGSGTTGEASSAAGRNTTLIELDDQYISVIENRLGVKCQQV